MNIQHEIFADDCAVNREKDEREAKEEHVRDELTGFITKMCQDFGWDPYNVDPRKQVGQMIEKALK